MNFIPPELEKILLHTAELERAFLVGGCVRDALLGRSGGKDFDVEVFGVNYEQLVRALTPWGRTDLVGRSFGVVKLNTGSEFTYDFTVPRQDSKIAPGHKGFEIKFDPGITPRQAAARRDFTINAIMYDPRQRETLDFFGGETDLRYGVLRHTSEAFVEDPLRVLRGMQFAGRFNLRASLETIEICRQIKNTFAELAVERVREEWFKWAVGSAVPSAGLNFLRATEWMDHFPEIKAMIDTPQEPEWHPEGDVYVHTCHCCDAMAGLEAWQAADSQSRIVYMLATLAHDFGKPATTHQAVKDERLRIVSPGHEEAGAELAAIFLERMRAPQGVQARILPLVRNHLFHWQSMTDRAVRRLAKRLEPENIQGLCVIMTADSMGRPPLPKVVPQHVTRLLERARELQVRHRPPEAILMGRHLLELGLTPGKMFGAILHKAYQAQLEGAFFDLPQAWGWLAQEENLVWPEEARAALRKKISETTEIR
ncbi:MAG TPA: HD domain-containing protein [Candidatus Saccharimonadales bacterium]|nr:HD domain-containing protein [Candidatus Saccharimonadales bacterium]